MVRIVRFVLIVFGPLLLSLGLVTWFGSALPSAAAAKLIALSEAAPEGLPAEPDAGTIAARLGVLDTAHPGLVDWDVLESIVQPGKFILLTSWRDAVAAEGSLQGGPDIRHRCVRVIRDYGMFDRAEAPQYYPPVRRVV